MCSSDLKINSIEEHAKTEEYLSNTDIEELCKNIKSASRKEIDIIFEEIDRIRNDVEHGHYILGGSEIDSLDSDMVYRVFQVKRSVNDIMMALKVGLAGIYEREEIEPKVVKSLIFDAVKEFTLACRHILPLIKMSNERV